MKSEKISEFLQSRIDAKDFPSAVYLVAEKGTVVFQEAFGFAVVEPERIAAQIDTIYDLASLTKPLVTGLLCAKLLERKELDLDRPIDYYLFASSGFESLHEDNRYLSINELLLHVTRLPAWKPFYLLVESPAEVLMEIIATPPNLEQPDVTYSDLNFLLLGFVLEKICGKPLDEIAREEIFTPLNLKNTFFNPPKELKRRIAASEKRNEYELQMAQEKGYGDTKIRNPKSEIQNRLVWGEVHDGNCHFMNGVSGHAGLFSNAFETFKIAEQFLPNSTRLLKPETCRMFRTNFTDGLNEPRSVAFQLAAAKDSTASEFLAKDSFGHLGFTGTSVWIEPETERIFILLTNRTHARELPFENINAVRRKFHELAVKCLNER